MQWKKKASVTHKILGKKASNRAVVKKASNLAAARKDRLKKEEEKMTLVAILNEIKNICNQNQISKTAQAILSLFIEDTNKSNLDSLDEVHSELKEEKTRKRRK